MLYPALSFLSRSLFLISLLIVSFSGYLSETWGKSDSSVTISGLILPPASGNKPDSMVVLFHGWGDNNENFLFLGTLLGQFLPDTLFVAPDAPIACKTIPSGRQWLSATSKNNKPQQLKEIKKFTLVLNQYLNNLLKEHEIYPEKVAFLGYSQGAKIALHVGLRYPQSAGIVAMSGSYLEDPTAVNLLQSPILIVHGIEDKNAPVSLARESHKALEALKMPVTLLLLPGVKHDIDPQGLAIAGEFLRDCLHQK